MRTRIRTRLTPRRRRHGRFGSPKAHVYNAYVGDVLVASRYIVPNKPGLGAHVCNTGVIIDKAWRGKGFGKQLSLTSL